MSIHLYICILGLNCTVQVKLPHSHAPYPEAMVTGLP